MLTRAFSAAIRVSSQNGAIRRMGSRVNVILLEDMENLGSKGEEVSVAAGLHRNFLYPKKKAVYSTTENKKRFLVKDTQSTSSIVSEARSQIAKARQIFAKKHLRFRRHSPNGTQLKRKIDEAQILEALRSQLNVAVEENRIRMPEGNSIDTVGDHIIQIELEDIEKQVEMGLTPRISEFGRDASEEQLESETQEEAVKAPESSSAALDTDIEYPTLFLDVRVEVVKR